MAKIPKRLDQKSLESWLATLPRDHSIFQRCALRVFPTYGIRFPGSREHREEGNRLLVLRELLTVGVARKYPTLTLFDSACNFMASISRTISRAAKAAGVAAGFNGADTTADAFVARIDGTSSAWEQIRNDLECLERGDDLLLSPLWFNTPPIGSPPPMPKPAKSGRLIHTPKAGRSG